MKLTRILLLAVILYCCGSFGIRLDRPTGEALADNRIQFVPPKGYKNVGTMPYFTNHNRKVPPGTYIVRSGEDGSFLLPANYNPNAEPSAKLSFWAITVMDDHYVMISIDKARNSKSPDGSPVF